MSIKRSREAPRRHRDEGGSFEAKKGPERVYTWEADVSPRLGEAFHEYAPAHRYPKDSLLEHKVFGKGVVTRVDGPKIEVLFQQGPKKLAHNPAGGEAPIAQAPGAQEASAAQVQSTEAPAAPAAPPEKT